MKKTRKFGKRRNLVKKHKSRRKAKGKTYEEAVSALLSKKLNDVHSRTYGQEFVDPGDPSLVSQILSHLPTSWIKEANEEQRLVEVISDLQQNIEKQKQQLLALSKISDVNKRQVLYQEERAIQLAETLEEVRSDIFKKYNDYRSSGDFKNNKHYDFLVRMLDITIGLTLDAENNSKNATRILNDSIQSRQSRQSKQSRQSRQSKQSRHSTRYGRTK
jgi:hypothetical protein